jgi:SAM-dependent methyltransferase
VSTLFDRESFYRHFNEQYAKVSGDEAVTSGLAQLLPRLERTTEDPARRFFLVMLDEAWATLGAIRGYIGEPGEKRALEIGGGIGITLAWLVQHGYDASAIEPALSGHSEHFDLGLRILRRWGVDPDRWIPLPCERIGELHQRFDLIFSNNVLEHIGDLDAAFAAMAGALTADGRLRHHCPNYSVPYEPHFGIPLLPLFPRATASLFRGVGATDLWRGLNFVNPRLLRRLCERHGLALDFDRAILAGQFRRFDEDRNFADRHPALTWTYRRLRSLGLLRALEHVPPEVATPIRFSAWRARPAANAERRSSCPAGPSPSVTASATRDGPASSESGCR